MKTIGCSSISQSIPSALRPAWMFIVRAVSSIRKTPAKPSSNGTTAELKMLFERGRWSRAMIGLRLERQSVAALPGGRSSHGIACVSCLTGMVWSSLLIE